MLALVERLPEGCATYGMLRDPEGWREHVGASLEYQVLAGVYDALNVNTAASGNWRRKPPKFDPWPTPQRLREDRGRVVRPDGLQALLGAG